VHAALRKAASGRTFGRDAVIEPARRDIRISRTPVNSTPIQPDQLHGTGNVADNQYVGSRVSPSE
jgi:hypothetical protein